MKNEKTLEDLIDVIILEMKSANYNSSTIELFKRIFKRLKKLASTKSVENYNSELGSAFIEDNSYSGTSIYCHTRYCLHYRCIQFLESYLLDGKVDWTPHWEQKEFKLLTKEFNEALADFWELMKVNGLKHNTVDGYRRIVRYFLRYLEDKGYKSFSDIKKGDIIEFIVLICKEHYHPTSLGSHLPGMRIFLKMSEITLLFEDELPQRLPKKREIMEIYSDEEHEKILNYLETNSISYRNKAICLIAFETGLRAVDICNLKLTDIKWEHNFIHLVQEKTEKTMNIPLQTSIGNALIDYILTERPVSDSVYIFLTERAPYPPLMTHSGCHYILLHIISDAGIKSNGRPCGTRITRHSMASRLLRHGISLPVIMAALGHSDPNSVMIYLSTDGEKLAECTLPLPKKGGIA